MADLRTMRLSVLVAAGCLAALVMPVAAQNYDGNHQVRFGAFLLGGTASSDVEYNDIATGTITNTSQSNGVYGLGVSGGLEWLRRGSWSWGIEADGTALQGSSSVNYVLGRNSVNSKIGYDYLATVRARGGLYLRNDVLWYGTLGVALLGTEARTSNVKVSSTQTGLAIGTGLEYDFGGGMLFAEYLYAGFGDLEASAPASLSGPATHYAYNTDMHTFRVGVKFKVGHDWYHDDVAERTGRVLK